MSSVNEPNSLILLANKTELESVHDNGLPHDGEGSATGEVALSQQGLDATLSAHSEHERQVAGYLFSLGVGYTKVAWVTGMNINTMRDWERAFKAGKFYYEPRNRRYSEKEKRRAMELRKEGKSLKQISVEMNCSQTAIRNWLLDAQEAGHIEKTIFDRKDYNRRPYTPEDKALALKLRREQGLPAEAIAEQIGCSFPTARRWLKEAQETGELERVKVRRCRKDKSDKAQD